MSSEDPIESTIAGITKGVVNLSIEKIKEFVRKFREKELSFIKEKSILEVVREQYASGESKFYTKYIKDRRLLLFVRLGLTLRRLEGDKVRLANLQQKLLRKYEIKGLHVTYFVQNGILNRYIGILIEEIVSEKDLEEKIAEILNNIEKYTLFVTWQDKPETIIKKALVIIASHIPSIFILSGMGSASKIVKECTEKLSSLLNEYELEKVSGGNKEILFFKRVLAQET